MALSLEEFQKLWSKIVAKSWKDEAFAQKLMDNPIKTSPDTVYDTEELKGFARSMSELQMLLLIPRWHQKACWP